MNQESQSKSRGIVDFERSSRYCATCPIPCSTAAAPRYRRLYVEWKPALQLTSKSTPSLSLRLRSFIFEPYCPMLMSGAIMPGLRVLFVILIWHFTKISPVDSLQYSESLKALINRLDSQRSTPTVQELAAKGVLKRLLPSHVSSFDFKIIPKNVCDGSSCFWVENYNKSSRSGPRIAIKGTTAVEITSGLHWYLKHFCGAHISWEKTGGVQIASIPESGSLPLVNDSGLVFRRPIPWNYYQNVVTSSYSFVWWDWERWEKEIDWMALQGINLPLAFTGQEAIWQKVFMDFNISREDLNDFFGGPAFLAWARMGNLHGVAFIFWKCTCSI